MPIRAPEHTILTRRLFLLAAAALPILTARRSRADGVPEIWSAEPLAKPVPGAIIARHPGGSSGPARLIAKVTPTETTMLSSTNTNTLFRLWVKMPRQPDDRWQYLGLDGEWWRADSTGHDSTGSQTTFTFDRDTARRIAAAFQISVHERTKLDGGLRYRWTFPPKATTNPTIPIPVILHVENAGRTTVGFMIGGRQRGPRDNRFGFDIHRNGRPIKIKEAHDFGGLGYYRVIKPGERAEVTCPDLRAWADLDLPGHYAITATYEGELAKDGVMPNTAAEQANLWDIVAKGQGAILVR